MAKQVKLKAEPRSNVGRSGVRKLRARGIIPAVIYGGKVKPQAVQVAARDINSMMSQASGENVLVVGCGRSPKRMPNHFLLFRPDVLRFKEGSHGLDRTLVYIHQRLRLDETG